MCAALPAQHNLATTTESKDSFILDWMRREEEMRTKFEYHREVGPVPGAFGNLLDNHGELLEQRVQRQREEEHRLQEQVLEQRRELELRQRFHVSRALQVCGSADACTQGLKCGCWMLCMGFLHTCVVVVWA